VGEAAVQERQGLVAEAPALRPIDAERPELRRHPADAHAELQAPARQLLHGGDPLGGGQRRPVREDQHAGGEPDARGEGGEPGQRREGIEVAPLRALGVVGRDGDVVGKPEVVEARGLGRLGAGGDGFARRLRPHAADRDAELHAALTAASRLPAPA
jgi:hypothetical protein